MNTDTLQGKEALKNIKHVWRGGHKGLLVVHHTKSKLTHGDDALPVIRELVIAENAWNEGQRHHMKNVLYYINVMYVITKVLYCSYFMTKRKQL